MTKIMKQNAFAVFSTLTVVLSFGAYLLPIPRELVPVVMVFVPALVGDDGDGREALHEAGGVGLGEEEVGRARREGLTMVAAWMSAETGVGPSIASGSQV